MKTCTIIAIAAAALFAAPAHAGYACNFTTGECQFVLFDSCCYEGGGWCADMQCDGASPDDGIFSATGAGVAPNGTVPATGPCIDPMGCPETSHIGVELDPNGAINASKERVHQ